MIIATTDVDMEVVHKYENDPKAVVDYAVNLVPRWCRYKVDIVHNQRYYVALLVRNCLTIPFKKRKSLISALCAGIHISGLINTFTTIDTIIDTVDRKQLIDLFENGGM